VEGRLKSQFPRGRRTLGWKDLKNIWKSIANSVEKGLF